MTTSTPKRGACSFCNGTGNDPEASHRTCPACEGRKPLHADCEPLLNEDAWDALGALCGDFDRICVCCGEYVPIRKVNVTVTIELPGDFSLRDHEVALLGETVEAALVGSPLMVARHPEALVGIVAEGQGHFTHTWRHATRIPR